WAVPPDLGPHRPARAAAPGVRDAELGQQLGPIAPVARSGRRAVFSRWRSSAEAVLRSRTSVTARAPARGGHRPRRTPTLAPSTALLIRPRQAPNVGGCGMGVLPLVDLLTHGGQTCTSLQYA